MNEIDPSQFADESFVGGEPSDDHQEEIEEATSSNPIKSALFSTYKPDTTPVQLANEYEVSRGVGHVLYGCLQASGSGDMPALGNILVGLVLESRGWIADQRKNSSSSSSSSTSNDELPDNDIANLQ